MQGEKPQDFKGTLKKFIQYIGKFKAQVLLVMILAAASTAFAIVGPKIIGNATTRLFEGVIGSISGTGSGIDLCGFLIPRISHIVKIKSFIVTLSLLLTLYIRPMASFLKPAWIKTSTRLST